MPSRRKECLLFCIFIYEMNTYQDSGNIRSSLRIAREAPGTESPAYHFHPRKLCDISISSGIIKWLIVSFTKITFFLACVIDHQIFCVIGRTGKAVMSRSEEAGGATALEYRVRELCPGRRVQKIRIFAGI